MRGERFKQNFEVKTGWIANPRKRGGDRKSRQWNEEKSTTLTLLIQIQEAGLRRMVSPSGNATAKNLFRLFKACQDREGIRSADEFLGCAA